MIVGLTEQKVCTLGTSRDQYCNIFSYLLVSNPVKLETRVLYYKTNFAVTQLPLNDS